MGSTLQDLLKAAAVRDKPAAAEEKPRFEVVNAPAKTEPPAISVPDAESASPADSASPVVFAGPPKLSQPPLRTAGAADFRPPAESEGVSTGYTSFSNHVLDKVLRTLKPLEQVVLMRLLRLSHGFGKPFCKVALSTLATACNAGQTQIRIALKSLEAQKIIERGEVDVSNPNQRLRGVNYTIFLPMARSEKAAPAKSAAPAKTEPFKYKDLKEKNLKRPAHLDVGKNEKGEYEIKPLDEKGREVALIQLQEFAQDDSLEDFRKWYTPEDWDWLVKELEK